MWTASGNQPREPNKNAEGGLAVLYRLRKSFDKIRHNELLDRLDNINVFRKDISIIQYI